MATTTSFLAARLTVFQPERDVKTKLGTPDRNGQRGVFLRKKRKKKSGLAVSSIVDKPMGKVNGWHNVKDAFKDPAVENLFLLTQKHEETGMKNVDLQALGSDLRAVVDVLKRKGEQLRASERALELERRELKRLQNDLADGEKKIADALALQGRLQQELRTSKDEIEVLRCEMENVKLDLREREREIVSAQQALASREREMQILKGELQKKDEELSLADLDFRCKDQVLNEANLVISRQESQIEELRLLLTERENVLAESRKKREAEEQKLKIAEKVIEERCVAWMIAQQKMKELVREVCKYQGISLVAEEYLNRAKGSLFAVKEELIFSQRSLEESRNRLASQRSQIEEQRKELSVQKNSIFDYEKRLRDAHLQVENEREKLRLAEQKNKGLEYNLCCERQAVGELTATLEKDRIDLRRSIQEIESGKNELEKRSRDLAESHTLLGLKESEVVAVKLETQKLKSELSSMQGLLKDKGNDLDSAQKYIQELHQEISELKALMRTKEQELVSTSNFLKEKELEMNVMRLDLDDNKIKLSQAANIVQNITDLTNTLVGSATDGRSLSMDEDSLLIQTNYDLFAAKRALVERDLEIQNFRQKSEEDHAKKFREMEDEMKSLKELLRVKEKELLDTRRSLAVKDEELKALVNRLEGRENEIMEMREEVMVEANGLNKLYASVQNRIGDKTWGELAVEKLEIEATKLEADAAMHALRNIVDLSNDFIKETEKFSSLQDLSVDMMAVCGKAENSVHEMPTADTVDLNDIVKRDMVFEKTKKAVIDLTEMTEQMLLETVNQETQNKGKATTRAVEKLVMAAA